MVHDKGHDLLLLGQPVVGQRLSLGLLVLTLDRLGGNFGEIVLVFGAIGDGTDWRVHLLGHYKGSTKLFLRVVDLALVIDSIVLLEEAGSGKVFAVAQISSSTHSFVLLCW